MYSPEKPAPMTTASTSVSVLDHWQLLGMTTSAWR